VEDIVEVAFDFPFEDIVEVGIVVDKVVEVDIAFDYPF